MVVRRALPVHAVGPEVLEQVLVQLGHRQVEQAVVQCGQRQRHDQQRVELERAVVALRRERRAHVARLRLDALHERRRQPAGHLRQPLPGVDPVQDPPRGDVAGVVVRRHLGDERADQPLPRREEVPLAGGAEGVREVEPVIELDPLDPPLLVLGQRACSQSGSRPRETVSPTWVNRPAATASARSRSRCSCSLMHSTGRGRTAASAVMPRPPGRARPGGRPAARRRSARARCPAPPRPAGRPARGRSATA